MKSPLYVRPLGFGLFYSRQGSVEGFKPRAHIPDRKSIRLMTRAVQLGVAAAGQALSVSEGWERFAPDRRGFFVGASPQVGDEKDLSAALAVSMKNGSFDMQTYALEGIPLIHPLWLIRGLSNNILGYSGAFWDFQGVNMNYCQGPEGGFQALREGALAVSEGRADIVLAGAADSLVAAQPLLDQPCSEGGAFVLWGPSEEAFDLRKEDLKPYLKGIGVLGAATWPVALVRKLLAKEA